jgi:hypothetical protein
VARIKLGDLMIKAGLIDDLQLQSALALQRQWGGKLGDVLVNNGFIDEVKLWRGLAKQLGVQLVSLPEEQLMPGIRQQIPLDLCQKHSVFPVMRDDKGLTIATSDPNAVGGLDEVAFRVGTRLRIVLAPDREGEWAIRRYHLRDLAPCPPPKTKRVTDGMPSAQAPASSAPSPYSAPQPAPVMPQPQTSAAELAALAAQLKPPSTAWMQQASASEAELAIREAAHLLRYVVEACVQRGTFTREQYLAKLKAL